MSLLKSLEIIMIYKAILCIFCMFFSLSAMAKCDDPIRYHLNSDDGNGKYVIDLLNSILGADCLQSIPGNNETEPRAAQGVASGNREITWGVFGDNFSQLKPVRMNLFLGGFDFRSFLIDEKPDSFVSVDVTNQCIGTESLLDRATSLDDLMPIVFLSGVKWGDTDVLKFNGLKVVEGKYPYLPFMLDGNRACVYPRGPFEAQNDIRNYNKEPSDVCSMTSSSLSSSSSSSVKPINWYYRCSDSDSQTGQFPKKLTLKEYPGIALQYLNPYFIYVKDEVLRDKLEKAIQESLDNGSFRRFFDQYPLTRDLSSQIEKMLSTRRIIRLKHPVINTNVNTNNKDEQIEMQELIRLLQKNQQYYLVPLDI